MSGLGLRLVRQWVAGEDIADTVKRLRKLNTRGIGGMVNRMGEDLTNAELVEEHVAQYLELLMTIDEEKLDSCISLKLTQIGLSVNRDLLSFNLQRILRLAGEKEIFTWFDMEGSHHTDEIIETYLEYLPRFKRLGLALQAYLKRTDLDMKMVLDSDGIVRLVKGAYSERPDIAYKSKEQVQARYSRLVRVLFERASHFAVGTHDYELCQEAIALSKEYGKNPEFQFLMGVRVGLERKLVSEGFRVLDYIPYGHDWLPYMYRRFRERPGNMFLVFRSVFEG